MKLIEINFEGLPPTVNHTYGAKGKIRYKDKEIKVFQHGVINLLKTQWQNKGVYDGRIAFYVIFVTNNHRRWDIDNRFKALQDCFAPAGILKDDSQIDRIVAERKYSNECRTFLTLETIDE